MKQEIIDRINLLAQEGEPFLFVINYQGDDAFIQKLSDIDPRECLYDFEGTSNVGRLESHSLTSNVRWEVDAPSYEKYRKSFDVVNILVLRNTFEKTRKQMKANTLSINVLSDNLNFPMFAELTLKKT